MPGKPKHGKGKYSYQAKVSGKKPHQPVAEPNSASVVVPEKSTEAIKPVIKQAAAPVMPAAIPASMKKIDLVFEIKRIGIITAAILILLVILSVVLK